MCRQVMDVQPCRRAQNFTLALRVSKMQQNHSDGKKAAVPSVNYVKSMLCAPTMVKINVLARRAAS